VTAGKEYPAHHIVLAAMVLAALPVEKIISIHVNKH
jgi:hypothetical protein